MAIVALLAAAFAVALGVLLRMQSAAHAVRDIADTASSAHGLFRGWAWRRKFAKNPLDLVEDPREAAAAMMVMIAQSDGAVTERERVAILSGMVNTFGASAEQAEQMLAHGRWLARDVTLPDEGFRRLIPLLKSKLAAPERRQLIELLNTVAAAEAKTSSSMGRIEAEAISYAAFQLDARTD